MYTLGRRIAVLPALIQRHALFQVAVNLPLPVHGGGLSVAGAYLKVALSLIHI